MKLVFVLATCLIGLVLAVPAAAVAPSWIGPRIDLMTEPPQTFPANEPFHIVHGWRPILRDTPLGVGLFEFALELDGQPVEADFIERFSDAERVYFLWFFNFPMGLPAGTHTFTATWSGPCALLVEFGYYSGPCATPTEQLVAVGPLTRVIEFTP